MALQHKIKWEIALSCRKKRAKIISNFLLKAVLMLPPAAVAALGPKTTKAIQK